MNMPLSLVFLALHLGGCTFVYLSHRHQGWLARPLVARWRGAGALLLVLALGCALRALSAPAAVLLWLVLAMLAWSVLPLTSLLASKGRHGT